MPRPELARHVPMLVLAVAVMAAPVSGEVVTVNTTGTITDWFWNSGPGSPAVLPEALGEAFPAGTPFTASFTYDPAAVPSIVDIRGWTVYRGILTDWTLQTAAHTFTADLAAAYPSQVWVGNNHPEISGRDGFSTGLEALMDGSPYFAGFEVETAAILLTDSEGTALSNQALPSQICLGAWDAGLFQATLLRDGIFYFLNGTAEPVRTIDSDGDTLQDGAEIGTLGTDPCSADTDGDGMADDVDPDPLVPAVSNSQMAAEIRDTATGVLEIPEGAFDGPNANAQRGKRNALANRLQAAANEIEAGNLAEALQILVNIRRLLDGEPAPPDTMTPGPARDALLAEVDALIGLVQAALAG